MGSPEHPQTAPEVARESGVGFWRFIKIQQCAEIPAIIRFCYEVRPEVFAAIRVGVN